MYGLYHTLTNSHNIVIFIFEKYFVYVSREVFELYQLLRSHIKTYLLRQALTSSNMLLSLLVRYHRITNYLTNLCISS